MRLDRSFCILIIELYLELHGSLEILGLAELQELSYEIL